MISTMDQHEITEEAFCAAVKYISYRPRTELETRKRLLKRYVNSTVEVAIAKCYKNNLLNDQKFSEMWVESRTNSRPKSAYMIKRELISKGVNKQIAEEVTQSVDDNENALSAADKKTRSISHLPKDQFIRKLMDHLLRKGFNRDIVKKTTNSAWSNRNNR
ncbi:RecX family transcriptional regulator [Dehalococcoidia bacterium]|nr:RecX family transcriptional regulator [Dehalococcoidia bacterium]